MKNFSDHEFKPSDVINGLNEFYRKVGERRRFEAKYGLSGAAGPFLIIKRRCGDLKTSFYDSHAVEEAITWLREECDIFYTPGMKWADLKYKIPDKAAVKEFGTTDIREMYPECKLLKSRGGGKKLWISSCPSFRDDAFHRMLEASKFEKECRAFWMNTTFDQEREKVMNYCMNDVICTEALMREKERLDGKEALEAIRDIYDELDCPGEAQWRRMNGYDAIDEVPTLHMRDYIINKYKYFRDLSEFAWEQNKKLKDLINQIHEDSDV